MEALGRAEGQKNGTLDRHQAHYKKAGQTYRFSHLIFSMSRMMSRSVLWDGQRAVARGLTAVAAASAYRPAARFALATVYRTWNSTSFIPYAKTGSSYCG